MNGDETGNKKLSLKLSQEVHRKMKMIAAAEGMTLGQVIGRLVEHRFSELAQELAAGGMNCEEG